MTSKTYTLWNDTHGWSVGTFTGWPDKPGSVNEARDTAHSTAARMRREFPHDKFTVTTTR